MVGENILTRISLIVRLSSPLRMGDSSSSSSSHPVPLPVAPLSAAPLPDKVKNQSPLFRPSRSVHDIILHLVNASQDEEDDDSGLSDDPSTLATPSPSRKGGEHKKLGSYLPMGAREQYDPTVHRAPVKRYVDEESFKLNPDNKKSKTGNGAVGRGRPRAAIEFVPFGPLPDSVYIALNIKADTIPKQLINWDAIEDAEKCEHVVNGFVVQVLPEQMDVLRTMIWMKLHHCEESDPKPKGKGPKGGKRVGV